MIDELLKTDKGRKNVQDVNEGELLLHLINCAVSNKVYLDAVMQTQHEIWRLVDNQPVVPEEIRLELAEKMQVIKELARDEMRDVIKGCIEEDYLRKHIIPGKQVSSTDGPRDNNRWHADEKKVMLYLLEYLNTSKVSLCAVMKMQHEIPQFIKNKDVTPDAPYENVDHKTAQLDAIVHTELQKVMVACTKSEELKKFVKQRHS
jgi:hypothetical protein